MPKSSVAQIGSPEAASQGGISLPGQIDNPAIRDMVDELARHHGVDEADQPEGDQPTEASGEAQEGAGSEGSDGAPAPAPPEDAAPKAEEFVTKADFNAFTQQLLATLAGRQPREEAPAPSPVPGISDADLEQVDFTDTASVKSLVRNLVQGLQVANQAARTAYDMASGARVETGEAALLREIQGIPKLESLWQSKRGEILDAARRNPGPLLNYLLVYGGKEVLSHLREAPKAVAQEKRKVASLPAGIPGAARVPAKSAVPPPNLKGNALIEWIFNQSIKEASGT